MINSMIPLTSLGIHNLKQHPDVFFSLALSSINNNFQSDVVRKWLEGVNDVANQFFWVIVADLKILVENLLELFRKELLYFGAIVSECRTTAKQLVKGVIEGLEILKLRVSTANRKRKAKAIKRGHLDHVLFLSDCVDVGNKVFKIGASCSKECSKLFDSDFGILWAAIDKKLGFP